MVKLVKSRLFGITVIAWALFFPVMMTMDIRDLFILIGSFLVTASMTILHAYWPAMRDVLRVGYKRIDFTDFLALGLMCTWFAVALYFGAITFMRYWYDLPRSYFETRSLAFFQYMLLTGGILHLTAKHVIKNNIPRTSWPRIFVSLALGGLLGGFLVLTN